jgi:hypothetical protein
MSPSPDVRLVAVFGALSLLALWYVLAVPPSERSARRDGPHVVGDAGPPVRVKRPGLIRVRDFRPVGGIRRIRVLQGDRVELRVRSDRTEAAHLDGYDLRTRLSPGRATRLSFDAERRGSFALELEGSAEQLAELRVETRPGPRR